MAETKETPQLYEDLMNEGFAEKNDYEFYHKAESNIYQCQIYRKAHPTSGLYKYYSYGLFKDISAEILYYQMMDATYRTKWDEYAVDIQILEKNPTKIYWNVKFPWPLSNRDYVYDRNDYFNKEKGLFCVTNTATTHPSKPEKSSPVRVVEFLTSIVFLQKEKDSYFWIEYYDDPRGNIPTKIINWAVSSALPKMLGELHKACTNYPEDRLQNMREELMKD